MDNGEVLQCPAKSTKAPIDSGYESLAEHLIKFHELGQMPVQLDIKSKSPQESNKIKFLREGLKTQFRPPFSHA